MGVKQNKRFLKSIDLPHSYFLPFIVMICTSAITLIYLIFDEYYTSYNELNRQLLSESERIERSFSDVVKHTEFVMKVILMQIKTDYKNIEHVENVMNKYSVNPHLNNVLAWTVFSWFDENGIKKVDSMSGTLVQQTHDNTRFYLSNKKRNDGELQIGDVIFGLTSKRNVLPASISASGTDGQDIGYLTIGFDLFELCENLRQKLKDPDITFALLNKNFEIVTQQNGFSKRGNIINESSIKKLVKNKNISFQTLKSFSQSNLLLDNNGVYMQKLQNYPFAIYLQYNNHRFIKSLRKDVVYRSFEVFIFTVVSFFIIVFIYKR
ncbi:MAG: hypothetical protein K0T99_03360, partial [Alphaproteobacteria bacterium]|nr:hypothetical protein [Alphaproteobacteria bacterium]